MAKDYSVGYALIDQCGIPFPSTVAMTERGAMVNALVSIWSHMVYATDGDEKIKADFARLKPKGYEVGPVAIEKLIAVPDGETES